MESLVEENAYCVSKLGENVG